MSALPRRLERRSFSKPGEGVTAPASRNGLSAEPGRTDGQPGRASPGHLLAAGTRRAWLRCRWPSDRLIEVFDGDVQMFGDVLPARGTGPGRRFVMGLVLKVQPRASLPGTTVRVRDLAP